MTERDLAYIYGAYLTDCSIAYNGVTLAVTDIEFRDKFAASVNALGFTPHLGIRLPTGKMILPQYIASVYRRKFVEMLYCTCDRKEEVPDFILYGDKDIKLEFLAAIIDGDGSVSKDGSIRIRSSNTWIYYIQDIAIELGIRSNEHVESMLPNGKEYVSVTLKRSDYRSIGCTCYIRRKADRILNASDTRPNFRLRRR